MFKDEMWEDICGMRMQLGIKEVTIDLRKVKSHATAEEMELGLSSPTLKHGNDRADYWAGKGAELYQVPSQTMNLVRQIDAETWLILKRLVKIVQTSIPQHCKQELTPMARINTIDNKLEELGHHLEIDKSGNRYSCSTCGQCWNKQQRNMVISYGVCPGPSIWGENQGMLPEIPRNLARGSELIWAGHKIHKTHSIVWKRGLVICMRCGSLSQGRRVGHLIEKCKGVPKKGDFPGACLKRFRNGDHPYPRGTWPLPAEASPPAMFHLEPDA